MSYHLLTFADLKNEAEHAIGGVPDSRTSTARIVNSALEYLTTKHDWTWRTKITTLDFTADVGEVNLPEDFSELIDICGKGLLNTSIRKTDPQTVNRVRVYGLTNSNLSLVYFIGMAEQATGSTGGSVPYTFTTALSADPTTGKLGFDTATAASITQIRVSETDNGAVSRTAFLDSIDGSTDLIVFNSTTPSAYRVFRFDSLEDEGTWDTLTVTYVASGGAFANNDQVRLSFVKNTGTTGAPRRQLVIGPIPASDQSQALYLTYRKLIPTLVNDTDVPAIPLGFSELLRVLVRAMAYSDQTQQMGIDWQRFNAMWPDYVGSDTMSKGQIQGQLADQIQEDYYGGDYLRTAPHTQILMPGEP